MALRPWLAPIALLLLAGCASTSKVTIPEVTQDDLKTSPAGASSIVFADLEGGNLGYRTDALPMIVQKGDAYVVEAPFVAGCATVTHPAGGTGDVVTRLTFTGTCKSANGWPLTGTITYTVNTATPTRHEVAYDLTAKDSTQTKQWHYGGTKVITRSGNTATIVAKAGSSLTAEYTDSGKPSNNKSYVYNPNLTTDWSTTNTFKVHGSFSMTLTGNALGSVSASVASTTPVTWNTGTGGCCHPVSGTIKLTLDTAQAEAIFGPTCGALTLNGAKVDLSSCN